MPSVEEHYSRLLADVYSWMYGGWDAALARYTAFFESRDIAPRGSRCAVDLGAGCGFQAIPLARLGFSVAAIDLDSQAAVTELAADVFAALEPGGTFIATFRDFTVETKELERFIPVRSDDKTVFTCFLEFEPDTVKVHDLVHRRVDGHWNFAKSFYRKLRLPTDWVVVTLRDAGFGHVETGLDRGLVVVTANKR
jgi:hypothetical protein